jgi:hypothetical protein
MRVATVTHHEEVSREKGEEMVPSERLVDSIKEWMPLAGLLVLHLLLGLVVDRLKSGKPIAIEEILAR